MDNNLDTLDDIHARDVALFPATEALADILVNEAIEREPTPREIERIDRILSKLRQIREIDNDLRFGQLLFNIGYIHFPNHSAAWGYGFVTDPYNFEDTFLEENLDAYLIRRKQPNGQSKNGSST